MRLLRTTGLWLLCLLTLLTACASAPETRLVPELQIVRLRPPEALLTCPAAPEAPQAQSQKEVARYVVALHAAGAACRQALDEVKVWGAGGE
jgi:hypothetical protein